MAKEKSKKECAIVMYHYVRNSAGSEYPGIKGLEIEKFSGQLDYIVKNHKIIGLEDYVKFLNGEGDIPDRSCVLTFDDGFLDHYANVFPILKKKKIIACFFPITQPLTEFVIPAVHQTHFLLAKLGSKKFAEEFNHLLKERFSDIAEKFMADGKFLRQEKCFWDKEDILAGNLKYNISLMPKKEREEVLKEIFGRHFEDTENFCRKLYMNFEQMKEMARAGMLFGGHTHSHQKLAEMEKDGQKKEISKSKKIMEEGLGSEIKFFSYPYGSYNNKTIEVLKNENFFCAITTDFDINKGMQENLFALKRLDTNHVFLKL